VLALTAVGGYALLVLVDAGFRLAVTLDAGYPDHKMDV